MFRSRRALGAVILAGAAVTTPRACRSCEEDPPERAPFESYGAAACAEDAARLPPAPPGPDRRPLVAPSPEAVAGAAAFAASSATARVYFAGTTGDPLFVHADGQPLWPALHPDAPLADGSLADVLRAFVAAREALFRVDDAGAELRPEQARPDPLTGGAVLLVGRWWGERRVSGDHAIAWFDRDGALLAVVARLSPTARVAATYGPIAGPAAALDLPGAAWEVLDGRPALTLRDTVPARPGGLRVRRLRVFDPVTGAESLRFAVVEVRSLVPIDPPPADGGEAPSPIAPPGVGAPDDWVSAGIVAEVPAPDPAGVSRAVWSTRTRDVWSLGWHGVPYLRSDQWVSVADADHRLLALLGLWFVDGDPISTRAPSWADDPAYVDARTAATDLARHLRGVLGWYASVGGVSSWDDAGSAVSASINANPWGMDGGMFNAYSDQGRIAVGAGTVPATGLTLASAPDVIGHEHTHSFVAARTGWPYEGETGAVAESLADVLGNAFEGVGTSYAIAEATGSPVRDLSDPARFGMPAAYDDLRLVTDDHGGVHVNSGILSRAAIEVWEAHARDPQPLAELVVHALRTVPFPVSPRIEEVGAALLASCFVRDQVAADPDAPAVCAPLERGLCTTRLLSDPGPASAFMP